MIAFTFSFNLFSFLKVKQVSRVYYKGIISRGPVIVLSLVTFTHQIFSLFGKQTNGRILAPRTHSNSSHILETVSFLKNDCQIFSNHKLFRIYTYIGCVEEGDRRAYIPL